MNRILRTALALALFACANLLLISSARAQSVYGSIFGTVTDKSGAAVGNATVTVTDEAKGTIVTVTSNASGDYSVPHLIPDIYDLKVSAQGFKTFETKGIQVEADTAPRIDPTLDVGGASETVQVSADQEPQLKTDRSDVATVFDEQQVSSLPVGDQNFTNLQLLLPGAQKLGWSHAADENPQGSQQIQVDGQAFGGTAFELDGTDNQDPILGIIVINPAMDAVTETKITTQNFDAELGKAVSAVVTAQTRSGTNNFHGSAYDFRTGNANLARDPFSQPPGHNAIPPGLKNRFGGSIGGPVLKNKAFFFGNYEGQRQKVGTTAGDTLPTTLLTESCLGKDTTSPAQLAAGVTGCDFSEYLNLATLTGVPGTGTIYQQTASGPVPYAQNVIPKAQLSGPALTFLGLLEPYVTGANISYGGSGNLNGLDRNYNGSGTGLFNSDQWTARGDYTINDRMHAFGRFSRFTDTLSGTVLFGTAGGPGFGIGNYGGNSKGANDSLASGMDIALGPKLLTDFRLGYYRYNVIDTKYSTAELANTWGIPGINTGNPFTAGAPGFQITGLPGASNNPLFGDTTWRYGAGLGVNRCNCPLTEKEDQYQIVNNWTKVLGNHTVKIGADLRYGRNLRVPSDTDRAGLLQFSNNPTSNQGAAKGTSQGGLGFATYMLGDVTQFGRYVSTTTNAKEFQKRTFFYAQDTWRATHALTLNLGLRYELYFPESVNGPGNGSLMNLKDGYMHVAGIGGVPSDMGWGISYAKMFAPRIGAAYQLNDKTVVRAGYGRSFDTGVFGSIFGHVVTQNLPVLANQSVNPTGGATSFAFTLSQGPQPYAFPTVPSNGLLPAQGYAVNPKIRPNPLTFPTIDAWNLAFQRALTPSTALTIAYVGNKGTHTLSNGDGNTTNPNEDAIFLPGQYSINGQALHYDPAVKGTTPASNGGTSNVPDLRRYYGGTLPACADPNYISLTGLQTTDGDSSLKAGMCGWTSDISYYGNNQNTTFEALQVTLAQNMWKGLAMTANYQWASSFNANGSFSTWNLPSVHGRDDNVRDQQLVVYGSYDLPFGKGKQFLAGANKTTDLIVGGWQLSPVLNWSGGLPFTLSYGECGNDIPSDAPCYPNAAGHMKTNLQSFDPASKTRTFFPAQKLGAGLFSDPGLDTIGNNGRNTYFGPSFFNTDMALTKAFSIWESVAIKFRVDAYNVFNHINPGQPGGNVESAGTIANIAPGCQTGLGNDCAPRQLEFSLRVQF